MKTCKNIEVDSNEFVYPWLTNFENDVATIKQPRGMNVTNIIASLACSGILSLFRWWCRFVFRDGAGSPAGRRESSRS